MVSDDPFAGIHLSEQTPAGQTTGKLDQRLFAAEPPGAPPAAKPAPPSQPEPAQPQPAKPPSQPSLQAARPGTTARAAAPALRLDLKEEPLYKASFLFTQEELERLEDLKLELRREHDTKVTKNGLIRSALHLLLEDHAANGGRSYASRKVRQGLGGSAG